MCLEAVSKHFLNFFLLNRKLNKYENIFWMKWIREKVEYFVSYYFLWTWNHTSEGSRRKTMSLCLCPLFSPVPLLCSRLWALPVATSSMLMWKNSRGDAAHSSLQSNWDRSAPLHLGFAPSASYPFIPPCAFLSYCLPAAQFRDPCQKSKHCN